jgi:hypothetical protein
MMLDGDVAAVSPATTYRVLKAAALIGLRFLAPSRKGDGFEQPLQPHQHWHVDFSHVNVGGSFYYLCSVLDDASRAILAWDIRPQMREADAEIVIQRARGVYPQARPRIITDNGPQFSFTSRGVICFRVRQKLTFTCFSALSGIDGEGFCWLLYDGCAATHLDGPKTSRAVVQGAAANGESDTPGNHQPSILPPLVRAALTQDSKQILLEKEQKGPGKGTTWRAKSECRMRRLSC